MNLEKIKAKILWVSGYYDGPIDGAALVNDEVVWFSMIEDYEPTGERDEYGEMIWSPSRWVLYRLSFEDREPFAEMIR